MKAKERYHAARAAAATGRRYEEALRDYIWFHDHALEEQPSLYGPDQRHHRIHGIKRHPYGTTTIILIANADTVRQRSPLQAARFAEPAELAQVVVLDERTDHDELYSGSREQLASCHEYERAHLDTNATDRLHRKHAPVNVYTPRNIPTHATATFLS